MDMRKREQIENEFTVICEGSCEITGNDKLMIEALLDMRDILVDMRDVLTNMKELLQKQGMDR